MVLVSSWHLAWQPLPSVYGCESICNKIHFLIAEKLLLNALNVNVRTKPPPNQWHSPYMFVFVPVLFMSVYFILFVCGQPVFYHSILLTPCLSGPCLLTSSSSSLSTLSPVGPDSPLKCFAKAGKMEPNQLINGFGPFQPAVAVHWSLQYTQILYSVDLYF